MAGTDDIIRSRLRLAPVPGVPGISLYQAHAGSGLSRLLGEDAPPPYWAYNWAGGTVLARYILDHPDVVAGKTVLDYGCGGGIVAIVAAKCGAKVQATDIDPHALTAVALNAEANGVRIELSDSLNGVDLILGGDVFYDEAPAERNLAFLTEAGREALIGDPGRKWLPVDRLQRLATYDVPDFGSHGDVMGAVYSFTG
ncbi:MAG: methyltransferase [Asticcacaulis sp.]|nr:methyltransferase [Asticcacaulis sp.]